MTLTAVPPELIGILEASTIAREDKERINDFFAHLEGERRAEVMREIRSRGNWQDKIRYCLQQTKGE